MQVHLRRYLVFTYYADRPLGGAHDFLDSFSTIQAALDNLLDEPGRYYQIVERRTMRVVRQGLTAFKNYHPAAFRRVSSRKQQGAGEETH